MKIYRVCFLGLGVVGSQLLKFIEGNKSNVLKQYGVEIIIDKVYVRNLNKQRNVDTTNLYLTVNPYEAMVTADIVIECIGGNGTEMTKDLILWALEHKKAVVMSSKKCLAQYGKQFITAAEKNEGVLKYDATVGGCIPISMALEQMGKCENIKRIYGICNATSNFILTQMAENKIDFNQALQYAKVMGIVENNPEEDVDGFDSLNKAIVMCGIGMGTWINDYDIIPGTIKKVSVNDIERAKENGFVIKPIFEISKVDEDIKFTIGPKWIEKNNILANVTGKNNMIIIEGSESGERAFYGQGAGNKPTASAMYDDLIKVISCVC